MKVTVLKTTLALVGAALFAAPVAAETVSAVYRSGSSRATKMAPSKIGLGVARKGEFAEIESSGNVRHGDWREYALQGIGIPLI